MMLAFIPFLCDEETVPDSRDINCAIRDPINNNNPITVPTRVIVVSILYNMNKTELNEIYKLLTGKNFYGKKQELEKELKYMLIPKKYYKGLSFYDKMLRLKEITVNKNKQPDDRSAYRPSNFTTNSIIKTKKSSYTKRYHQKFGIPSSISDVCKQTGIPKAILQQVYDRGMAAWRTGHRPSATQAQWGWARVYSFVMKGPTHYFPDHLLVEKAKNKSPKAKKMWSTV